MDAEQRKSEIETCVELAKVIAARRNETRYVIEIDYGEETAIVAVGPRYFDSDKGTILCTVTANGTICIF